MSKFGLDSPSNIKESIMAEAFNMLGTKVKDKITGFSGVVTSLNFDLFGCIQVFVTPKYNKESTNPHTGHYFDICRLECSSRIMDVPQFNKVPRSQDDLYQHGPVIKSNPRT